MKKKNKMPKELYVYIGDWDGEDPILCVAEKLSEIPEDCDGNLVGSYALASEGVFGVSRFLQPPPK